MKKHQKVFFIIIFLCLATSTICSGYEEYVNSDQPRVDLDKTGGIINNENVCGKDNLETIIIDCRKLLDKYDMQLPGERKKDNLFDFLLNTKKFIDFTITCSKSINNKNWDGAKVHLKNMDNEINGLNKLKRPVSNDGYTGTDDIIEFMVKTKEHCADSVADYLKAQAEKSPALSGKRDYWVIIVDIYDSAGITRIESKNRLDELTGQINRLQIESEKLENDSKNYRNEANKNWWIISFRGGYDKSILNYNEAIKNYEQIGGMNDKITEIKKTISDIEEENGMRTKSFMILFILSFLFILTIIICYVHITKDIMFESKYDKSVKKIWGKQ